MERDHVRKSIEEHMEFLRSLPEGLVKELFHEARAMTLSNHPFFAELGAQKLSWKMWLFLKRWSPFWPVNEKKVLLSRDILGSAENQGIRLWS